MKQQCLFKKHVWREMDELYLRREWVYKTGWYKFFAVFYECARCGKEKIVETRKKEV